MSIDGLTDHERAMGCIITEVLPKEVWNAIQKRKAKKLDENQQAGNVPEVETGTRNQD